MSAPTGPRPTSSSSFQLPSSSASSTTTTSAGAPDARRHRGGGGGGGGQRLRGLGGLGIGGVHGPSSAALLSSSSPTMDDPDSPRSDVDELALLPDDDDADADGGPLPFPTALPRADFLKGATGRRARAAPRKARGEGGGDDDSDEGDDDDDDDFDPVAYLSSLPPRHQTLEDLRGELRQRSADISAELLDLVNREYAAFLGLGDGLRGGEDKVEDVRVSMLGFRRGVEEVRAKVKARRTEVAALVGELGNVRRGVETARRLLDVEERVAALEARLAVGSGAKGAGKGAGKGHAAGGFDGELDDDEDDDFDDEDDDDDDEEEQQGDGGVVWTSSSPAKLAALALEYNSIRKLSDSVGGEENALVRKMAERMIRCSNTILLDLGTALKEARRAGIEGQSRVLKYLAIYSSLGAQGDAVKSLKGA